MTSMRINRALAQAGVASRRGAEQLVLAGRVRVNGAVVTDLATTIDPARDKLMLDGKSINLQALTYFAYYKPRGIVTSMEDERKRPCVGELCRSLPGKPRPVGRLDRASEGLLILTSDGELANRLTHPRYGVRKEYQVTISPRINDPNARQMIEGVELEDGPARFEGIELQESAGDRSRLLVVVSEGRYRLIRRVCEKLGFKVLRLKRIRIGPVALGRVQVGETRPLSGDEIKQLKKQVGME
ncbi:rRNA pseudouridine synthase [bacterium]|nr:rRNA pseudouridine synthase [bacterium]